VDVLLKNIKVILETHKFIKRKTQNSINRVTVRLFFFLYRKLSTFVDESMQILNAK